ncbi:hypothetical protein F4809DRAFT_638797 [Biscogniauxia mediterranea]|nr:hypothetical protein F4809DRAFT_638797 [Biscogniauxia mediterranea]
MFDAVHGWISQQGLRKVRERQQLLRAPPKAPSSHSFTSSYGLTSGSATTDARTTSSPKASHRRVELASYEHQTRSLWVLDSWDCQKRAPEMQCMSAGWPSHESKYMSPEVLEVASYALFDSEYNINSIGGPNYRGYIPISAALSRVCGRQRHFHYETIIMSRGTVSAGEARIHAILASCDIRTA